MLLSGGEHMGSTLQQPREGFVTKDVGLILKKAHCGFDALEKTHQERIGQLIAALRGEKPEENQKKIA